MTRRQRGLGAGIHDVLAIAVAAGASYSPRGIEVRREWSAPLMPATSIIAATNGVPLKRIDRELA